MPRPATGVTPKRQIRISDAIWDAAMQRSREEGRALAKVVTEYLAAYGAQSKPEALSVDPWDVVNLVVREITAGRVGPNTDLNAAAATAAELLRNLGITPVGAEQPSSQD